MPLFLRFCISLTLAAVLSHCGTPSPPQCRTLPRESRGEAAILLGEARSAWKTLAVSSTPEAREQYNRSLAKLFDQLRCGTRDHHARAAAMGTVIDTSRTLGTGLTLEDLDAIFPASEVDTKQVGTRHLDPGIGIPVVGWKSHTGERRYEFAPPTGLPLNLTVILDFDPPVPTWRFLFPGRVESVTAGRRSHPLAADWSAPSAFYWHMSDLDDLDLAKVFLPTRFTDQTNLYATSPYSPEKTPVIFIHGLYSSPGTYKVMFNDLIGQKWFRDHYQAWFFSYPTGTSWIYNAATFRDALDKATEAAAESGGLENWNNMVLVGHSMGGVISHASLVDPGTRFYDTRFTKPIDELQISDDAREAIRRLALYQPVEEPSRVVFLAVPHRGSPAANRFFSRWISNLIRLPKQLTLDLLDVTLTDVAEVIAEGADAQPMRTSIGTLTPSFSGYKALNDSPIRPDVKVHTIIGDRGRGDSPDSSDGIVPYSSANLRDDVESKLIVPYGHSLTAKPETIAEVERILQLHLKEP